MSEQAGKGKMEDQGDVLLKPCPFCGSANVRADGNSIECCECNTLGPEKQEGSASCEERWNKAIRLGDKAHDAPKRCVGCDDLKQQLEVVRAEWDRSDERVGRHDSLAEAEALGKAYGRGLIKAAEEKGIPKLLRVIAGIDSRREAILEELQVEGKLG